MVIAITFLFEFFIVTVLSLVLATIIAALIYYVISLFKN